MVGYDRHAGLRPHFMIDGKLYLSAPTRLQVYTFFDRRKQIFIPSLILYMLTTTEMLVIMDRKVYLLSRPCLISLMGGFIWLRHECRHATLILDRKLYLLAVIEMHV